MRNFYVHLSDGPSASGWVIADAADSLEAALLFAERWTPEPGQGSSLRVHVMERATGERCCVTIDLGSGEAGPC